jgi:hypothetical protein
MKLYSQKDYAAALNSNKKKGKHFINSLLNKLILALILYNRENPQKLADGKKSVSGLLSVKQ